MGDLLDDEVCLTSSVYVWPLAVKQSDRVDFSNKFRIVSSTRTLRGPGSAACHDATPGQRAAPAKDVCTHFFSEPSFSLRDVYWPLSVLCGASAGGGGAHAGTHDEPAEDGNRSVFVGLRIGYGCEELRALAPVR